LTAIAEDIGTPGGLDGQPGIIYTGPGATVVVEVSDYDLMEGSGENPDFGVDYITLAVFKNSELVGDADEGLQNLALETPHEFNAEVTVTLAPGDVLRVGVASMAEGGNGADADYDLASAGTFTIRSA
jgi:hypothetical protein